MSIPRLAVSSVFGTLALAALLGAGFPRGPGGLRPPALPRMPPVRLASPDWRARGLPPIVFVSRQPLTGRHGAVPGLGPVDRDAITGGRLLVREPDGRLRELAGPDVVADASDPAVSFDGRRVAFAGVARGERVWRLHIVDADGRNLRALPRSSAGAEGTHDLDPCWIGPERLVFSSTRSGRRDAYAGGPSTDLFVVDLDGSEARRITAERNGADEPALDPRTGQIVYARWWFNPQDPDSAGREPVNLWHALTISPDGDRLACGDVRTRRGMMAYQITFLADGTPVGVFARNLGLHPGPAGLGIQSFPWRFGAARRLLGAIVPDSARSAYADATGLAAPAAVAPAGLPDGRLVAAYDPGGRGDFGLYLADSRGQAPTRLLVDLEGTLELDPAPLVARRPPGRVHVPTPFPSNPRSTDGSAGEMGTFLYASAGVFLGGRLAPGSPAPLRDARLRFLAAHPSSDPGAPDRVVVLGEERLAPDGSIQRALPADVPLFEQLVDGAGRILATPAGPAHVAGFNTGRPGAVSRCIGCHVGHSALPVPAPTRRDARPRPP